MRTASLLVAALAASAALAPGPAGAQLQLQATIKLPLPPMPVLVVVEPGIQVVQDFDDEVFLHGSVYWARRGDRWYRSRTPHGEFLLVEGRLVPEPLRRLPPGHYRRYRPPPPRPHASGSQPHHDPKKEEKRQRKEEEKARKAWEKDHPDDHGHDGHGHHDDKGR